MARRNRNRNRRRNNDSYDDDDDDWEKCPECGRSVKSKNFDRHLSKQHPDLTNKDLKRLREKQERRRPSNMSRSDRRREIMKEKRRKEDMIIFSALAIVIIGIVAGYFILTSGGGGNGSENLTPEPTQQAPDPNQENEVRISTSDINDGQAHYYSYKSGSKTIRYFVLKSSDGIYRAAFDACDTCYREKRGYRQEGDFMVCNNCGQRFQSTKINVVKGGCNPAPLTRTEDGNELIIKTSDIEAGNSYFP
jgi:uncharacterized membrane protein